MLGDAQGDALLVLSPPSLDSTTSDVVDKDRSTSTTRVALQKWNGTMVQAVKARRKQPLWLNLGSATMRRVNQTPAPPPEASVRRKGGGGGGGGESHSRIKELRLFTLLGLHLLVPNSPETTKAGRWACLFARHRIHFIFLLTVSICTP